MWYGKVKFTLFFVQLVLVSTLVGRIVCPKGGGRGEGASSSTSAGEIDVSPEVKFDEMTFYATLGFTSIQSAQGYPKIVDTAIRLADAWYMVESNQQSIAFSHTIKPFKVKLASAVEKFLQDGGKKLGDALNDLLASSISRSAENWVRWLELVNKHTNSALGLIDETQIDDFSNPRFNPQLSSMLIDMMDLDDVDSQRAFTHGKGFCILTKYLDSTSRELVGRELDLKISRILYLVWEAYKQNLYPQAAEQGSKLREHIQLTRVCRHLAFQPHKITDLVFKLRNFNKHLENKVFNLGVGNALDINKLERACSPTGSNIFERFGQLQDDITNTMSFDEEPGTELLVKELKKKAKNMLVNNCLGLIVSKLVLGLSSEELIPTIATPANVAVKSDMAKELNKSVVLWMSITERYAVKNKTRIEDVIDYLILKFKYTDRVDRFTGAMKFNYHSLLNPHHDTNLRERLAKSTTKYSFTRDAFARGLGLCENLRRSSKLSYAYSAFSALLVYVYPQERLSEVVSLSADMSVDDENLSQSSMTLPMKFTYLMIVCDQLKESA